MNEFIKGQNPYKTLNIGDDRTLPDVKAALNTLKNAWAQDTGFYQSWKANIAMQFVDHVYWHKAQTKKKYLNNAEIHKIANKAADAFLKILQR